MSKATRFINKIKAINEAHSGVKANVMIRFDRCDYKIPNTYGTPKQLENNAKFRLATWLAHNYANLYRTDKIALSILNQPKNIIVTIDPKDFDTIRGITIP